MKRILILACCLLPIGGFLVTASMQSPLKDKSTTSAIPLVGDGIVDETANLQQLIERSDRTINLPKGIYRITKPLVIDLDRVGVTSISGDGTCRILMDGAGPAIRILGTHQGTADPGTVKPNVWKNQRAPMISGIEIVGNHPEACGIEASGTMQFTLTRVVIRQTTDAVRLFERNRNVIISDCHFYENRGMGIWLDQVDLHQINVTSSHISYNGGGGVVSTKGNVRNLQITGCDIEANMSATGKPTANVLIDCRESDFGTAEVAITGCTIQHTRKAPDSANIRIFGRTNAMKDMPIIRQGHVTITGNIFSDVQTNIHLNGCRGVVISGNTFWEGFSKNLFIEDCYSVVMGANSLDRNPHYERFGDAKNAKNVIHFKDSIDCTISGLHITNTRESEAAITLERCQRVHVSGCTILDCDGSGIWLNQCNMCRIANNMHHESRSGQPAKPPLLVTGGEGNIVP